MEAGENLEKLEVVVLLLEVPEVGRPALEVGGGGAYLRVTNEYFAIVQKNCSLLKRI